MIKPLLFALCLGIVGHAAVARADSPSDLCLDERDPTQPAKFHIEQHEGRPVTVIDTFTVICERVPRPSVFYVLGAKNIEYAWQSLPPPDLTPLVLSTVKKAPF